MIRIFLNHPSLDLISFDLDELNKKERWQRDSDCYEYCYFDFFEKYNKWLLEKKTIDIYYKAKNDAETLFNQQDIYSEHFKEYEKSINNFEVLKYKGQYYIRHQHNLFLHDSMILYKIEKDDFKYILESYFNNIRFVNKPNLLELAKLFINPAGIPMNPNQKNGEVE